MFWVVNIRSSWSFSIYSLCCVAALVNRWRPENGWPNLFPSLAVPAVCGLSQIQWENCVAEKKPSLSVHGASSLLLISVRSQRARGRIWSWKAAVRGSSLCFSLFRTSREHRLLMLYWCLMWLAFPGTDSLWPLTFSSSLLCLLVVFSPGTAELQGAVWLWARERRRAGLPRGRRHHPDQSDRRELVRGHAERPVGILPPQLRRGPRAVATLMQREGARRRLM